MKRIIKFLTAGVALFTISTFSLTPPSVGVLTKMIQQVEFKAAETDAWDEAELGSIMNNGDEIRTGDRSLALIKFLDNSLLRLRENSVVTLYGNKEESKLNKNAVIQQGRVGFEVTPQDDQEFKFTTPTAVASIRGTKGFFEVPIDGSLLLFVKEGLVDIESLIGSQQSGSVGDNQVAKIDAEGNVVVEEATDEIQNQYESLNKENTKRIRLKLDNGEDYIIEYLN